VKETREKGKERDEKRERVKNYDHLGTVLLQLIDERSAHITMCGNEKRCIIYR